MSLHGAPPQPVKERVRTSTLKRELQLLTDRPPEGRCRSFDDGDHVADQQAARDLFETTERRERTRTDLHAQRFVGAVADDVV